MPAPPKEDDLPEIHTPNARVGMALFVVYLAAYAGFMGMATFALDTLGSPSPLGVNWGLLYGLGLILGAFVLAMIYMFLCRGSEESGKEGSR